MTRAKMNIAHAQKVLRARDQSKLASTAAAFAGSQSDMKQTASALAATKRDPQSQEDVRAAKAHRASQARTSLSFQTISRSLPRTRRRKRSLLDAGARFRALLKKI